METHHSSESLGGGVVVEGHTVTVLPKAAKLALPSVCFSWKCRGSRRVLNRLGFWQHSHNVCVHVSGIWYHETTTVDFVDVMSHLFHVWSHATLGVCFELVTLKGNIIISFCLEEWRLYSVITGSMAIQ